MAQVFVLFISISFLALVLKVFGPSEEAARHEPLTLKLDPPLVEEPSLTIEATADAKKPVSGEEPPNTPVTMQELRVAFNSNPPRKYMLGANAEGIAANILREFARRYGVSVRFDVCDLEGCIDRLKKGDSDIILEIAKNADRETFLQYLNPAISLSAAKCFYQRRDEAFAISKLPDLKGLNIGVLKGYSYFPEFDQSHAFKKITFSSIDAMVKGLHDRKIDAFIGMEDRTDFILTKTLQLSALKKAKFQIRENILVNFMAMAKTSPFLAEKDAIEDLLSAMYLDGTVERVVKEASMRFRLASAD